MQRRTLLRLICCIAPLVALSGCGIYSFTGTNISPNVKTISIQNLQNETGKGPTRLSQNLTEKLKEYFLQNSSLKLVKTNGDVQMEGTITGYDLAPVGAQQGQNNFQTGLQNRLTIRVKIKFTNTIEEQESFDKDFSFYSDFAANQSLSAVENQRVEDITDQIVLDIFNAALANW